LWGAEYRKVIQSAGFRASMSRKGDCYDNIPMESFFDTLKSELVHHRQHATGAEPAKTKFNGHRCEKSLQLFPPQFAAHSQLRPC
jgi:transposase InsO family protein